MDHIRIVLLRHNDLIPALQVYAPGESGERLGGISVNRQFICRCACKVCKLAAQGFATLVEDLPHIVGGRFVAEVIVTIDGILNDLGLWTDTAIVKVKDVG